MGISISCLHYGSLYERLNAFFGSLADLSCVKNKATGQTPILRALGSGKMLIERSLSLKKVDSDKKDGAMKFPSLQNSRSNSQELEIEPTLPESCSPKHEAAIKLQKVYKSFRTRRQLADCAVLVEQHWWKLLDFALLERSSVLFFDHNTPETANSRWSRAGIRAAKVGKGLSKDAKAQKLALQHWLEAIDARHRYGHNLHFYYLNWLTCESKQPFFYWLDVGEGKEVNLQHCPRSKLQHQCIKYLGPKEREAYEVIVEDGKLVYKQNHQVLDTSSGSPDLKWIFVLSTSKLLYVGQKLKGKFQHSSFLAGGATSSAGRLVVEKGILKAVWPHSGHYRPTEDNFLEFMRFLTDNKVDLIDVKRSPEEDEDGPWGRSTSSSTLGRVLSYKVPSKHFKTSGFDNGDGEYSTDVGKPSSFDGGSDDLTLMSEKPSGSSSNSTQSQMSCGHVNDLDIQTIYRGSEGETDEDADDDVGGIVSTEDSDFHEITDTATRHRNEKVQHYVFQKINLFEGKQDEETDQPIPKELILKRIDSIKRSKSLQLGRHWSSGVGARIGCVRDYPSQLQFQALEQVNLSPRAAGLSSSTSSTPRMTTNTKASGMHIWKHYSLDSNFCA